MRKVRIETSLGNKLYCISRHNEGKYLSDVYSHYSQAKLTAWNRCYQEYLRDETASGFRICSHNVYGFTVAWETDLGVRLETKDNSYLITMDVLEE